MNDGQKKVIRDINTELKALLKEAEPNETKLYILKKLVSNTKPKQESTRTKCRRHEHV